MTTALAAGMSPERLAPGDPEGARALAARLDAYAEGAGAATARLAALESGTWVGEAADAFRASLDTLPQRLRRASAAFAEAASALRAYALVAEEARRRAALALARFDDAQAATARWEYQRAEHDAALVAEAGGGPPAGPGPSGHDPGAGARRAAEGLAEELVADLEAAERAVEQRLRRAGEDAPDEPGFLDQAFRLGKEFVGGAVEATVGLGEFVFKLTPTYALIDPEGYVEHLVGLGQGIAYGVTHPVEFAQAAVNWDMWLDNPARALGQLVPDLVLAVGTAGAGTAATAASRAARGAEKLDDVADGARAAERLAGAADVRRTAADVSGMEAGGGLFRRTANTGDYTGLGVPMQLREVRRVAQQAGVGLGGVKIRIVRHPDLIGTGFYGHTPSSGRSLDLYPDAFTNPEQLVRTLGHERMHVYQMRTLGPPTDSRVGNLYEAAARGSEDGWWSYYSKGGP